MKILNINEILEENEDKLLNDIKNFLFAKLANLWQLLSTSLNFFVPLRMIFYKELIKITYLR